MNAPQRPNCPDDEVLQELAAGIGSPALAQQTMQHVARCKTCGTALRRYIQEFSSEQSPDDIAILNQLQSSKPQWQKRLVRKLIGGAPRFLWLKIAPATLGLAAVIFVVIQGPALWTGFGLHQAQKQVAAAFADRRTTEMRLPSVQNAPYRPFPIELGAENGRGLDEVPTSLHDASGAANKNLRAANADPRWLQIQGLALLWESTPNSMEKAEKDFEKARSAGLASPSLEIDLAASYFERDSRAEHPNLQRTLNLLSEVLSKSNLSKDDQASALFNLAIAYEKTQAWDLAVETWEKYLRVDSTSGWTNEARQHLKDAQAKTSGKRQQSYSDPSFFLRQKAQGTLRPEDPEQYQQKALTLWMPTAVADKESEAYRALKGLAEVFAEHQDFWWRDFLAAVGPKDLAAVQLLSKTLQDNETGLYDEALLQSRRAEAAFAQRNFRSAELLAGFAEVYALRNKLQGANCLARAGPLSQLLSRTPYHWLTAQLLLEDAQCRNFQIELADADHDLNLTLNIASDFGFPVQRLRVLGISAGMKHQQGKCDESWSLGVAGLELYWQGRFPFERLDQFYAVMWQCARETGSLNLAEVLLRQTIANREDPHTLMPRNKVREGMLHLRLANILLALKQAKSAADESQIASFLLKDSDQLYAKDYVLRTKIEPAEMQLLHGDAELALATLQPVEHLLTSIQDKFIVVSFYRVLGNINWELRRLDQASAAYQSAVNLAELSLLNLNDGPERLAWIRVADDSYRGLVRVLLEQKQSEQALERWEWYQGRPILQGLRSSGRMDNKVFDKKGNHAPAPPTSKDTRLIFASFKDGVQVWLSRNGRMGGTWIEWDQKDFERRIRDFADHCADPDSPLAAIQEQGLDLYVKLLPRSVSSLPDSETLVIELDRLAYNLPMEALLSPDGWYLGEKYVLVYSPGTRVEGYLRPPPNSINRQTKFFVLDASHAPKSGYLPGLDSQRNTIAELFPRSTIVDSSSSTWSHLRVKLSESRVFHYMGHGHADGSGTALAFSQGQSLSARDFTPNFFANAQLAVLAACSTAKARDNGNWDSDSLVHAFLEDGVSQIVASHWNVDSSTTSRMMVSFYQHVSAGDTVEKAAFKARKEILAVLPHPYYWAGFSVTGRVN
ncbi:MAG TPA: CHAT domain-containing protein [Candidatus Angelobacter sp.]|jgi:CHAT domain-containing protein